MNQEPKGDELPWLRRYKGICKWQRPGNRTSVKQALYNRAHHFRCRLSPIFFKLALRSLDGAEKYEKAVLGSQR